MTPAVDESTGWSNTTHNYEDCISTDELAGMQAVEVLRTFIQRINGVR